MATRCRALRSVFASFLPTLLLCVGCGSGGGGNGSRVQPSGEDPPPGSRAALAIDAMTPPGDVIAFIGQSVRFALELPAQKSKESQIDWRLDGTPVAGRGEELLLDTSSLGPGLHTVAAAVKEGDLSGTVYWKLELAGDGEEITNRRPSVIQALPPAGVVLGKRETVVLQIAAHDLDASDTLKFRWRVDGEDQHGDARTFTLQAASVGVGDHLVQVEVLDGVERAPGESVHHVWPVRVVPDSEPRAPWICGAWPLGTLRLGKEGPVRFEVDADCADSRETPEFVWTLNGQEQAAHGPVFDLDPMTDENLLDAGDYHVTCRIADPRGDADLQALARWTLRLTGGQERYSPAPDGKNLPPTGKAPFPREIALLAPGQSQTFQVEAQDPEGNLLRYDWYVDGVLQDAGGPITTFTVPSDYNEQLLSVQVLADDGRKHAPTTETVGAATVLGTWDLEVQTRYAQELALTSGTVIIDNGDPGTFASGYWTVSGASRPQGKTSLYSRSPSSTYAFQTNVPSAGKYEVLLWWTSWPSRAPDATVLVEHAGGTSRLKIDQRARGGAWNLVGSYQFKDLARVTIVSRGSPYSTCADAVCLRPASGTGNVDSAPPPQSAFSEFLIEDGSPGTRADGAWKVIPSTATEGHGASYRTAVDSGKYVYHRSLSWSQTYDVYAWWVPYSTRSTATPYVITHAGGTTTVKVDQTRLGGRWNYLGRWLFNRELDVQLLVGKGVSACADALRFVPVTSASPQAAKTVQLSWSPPLENADGSRLNDLAGYKVYYGSGTSALSLLRDVGSANQATLGTLLPGTYTFAVTAYDYYRNESSFSGRATITIK